MKVERNGRRGAVTQSSQREEHRERRDKRRPEQRKTKNCAEDAEVTEKMKSRESEMSDHKSPPFAEEREGWGTLKFSGSVASEWKPKRTQEHSQE